MNKSPKIDERVAIRMLLESYRIDHKRLAAFITRAVEVDSLVNEQVFNKVLRGEIKVDAKTELNMLNLDIELSEAKALLSLLRRADLANTDPNYFNPSNN